MGDEGGIGSDCCRAEETVWSFHEKTTVNRSMDTQRRHKRAHEETGVTMDRAGQSWIFVFPYAGVRADSSLRFIFLQY